MILHLLGVARLRPKLNYTFLSGNWSSELYRHFFSCSIICSSKGVVPKMCFEAWIIRRIVVCFFQLTRSCIKRATAGQLKSQAAVQLKQTQPAAAAAARNQKVIISKLDLIELFLFKKITETFECSVIG